jgi:hypothetical protein
MKQFVYLMLAVFLFPTIALSQIRWQTTHVGTSSGDCQLVSTRLTFTINEFCVNVEEEAVIAAIGRVAWGDSTTLEIFGTFTVSPGTSVRSMLLWNGNTILKAKLLDKNLANKQYEDVVHRDTIRPVVVRDPSLIEYLGNNVYRFKIYPVAINKSRKIRILYSVPFALVNDGPQFNINTAFTVGAALNTPAIVPIEVRRPSSSVGKYIINYGTITKMVQYGATYEVPYTDLTYRPTSYSALMFRTVTLVPDSVACIMAYATSVNFGATAGHYTAMFVRPPDTVKAAVKELSSTGGGSIEAMVTAGEKMYITDFNSKLFLGVYLKSLRAWDNTVSWTAYNSTGHIAVQCTQTHFPKSGPSSDTLLPIIWGAKYTFLEKQGDLGGLYGFVDNRMSLLALESDSLSGAEAAKWADRGVPSLKPEDILLDTSQTPAVPKEDVIFEYNSGIVNMLKSQFLAFECKIINRLLNLKFANLMNKAVRISLYDISGRLLQSWNSVMVNNGRVDLTIPLQVKGCVILRVYAGKEMYQKKIAIVR